jgi:hypothetical protein
MARGEAELPKDSNVILTNGSAQNGAGRVPYMGSDGSRSVFSSRRAISGARLPQRIKGENRDRLLIVGMQSRPLPEEFDMPLRPDQLREQRQYLAGLREPELVEAYRKAHASAQMESVADECPKARSLQELVTVWKVLWRLRRRGRQGRWVRIGRD